MAGGQQQLTNRGMAGRPTTSTTMMQEDEELLSKNMTSIFLCISVFFLVDNNWSFFFFTDPVQISELLAKTIGDAHSRTCLFSGEHIADMLRKPQDISKVHYYKNMVSRSTFFSVFSPLASPKKTENKNVFLFLLKLFSFRCRV